MATAQGVEGAFRPMDVIKEAWEMIKPQYWMFFLMTLVGLIIGGAAAGILTGAMMCGLFYTLAKIERKEPIEFGDLFKGFDVFFEALIAGLILAAFQVGGTIACGIVLGVCILLGAVLPGFLGTVFVVLGIALAVLLYLAVGVAMMSLFMFAFPLIMEKRFKGWAAIVASYRAARQDLKPLVVLSLLLMALMVVGSLACGVGSYFVAPVVIAAVFVAYRKVAPGEQAI